MGYDLRREASKVRAVIGLPTAERRARTAQLLERFDLGEAARQVSATYSGGMKRRLGIAMTLMGRPRMVFQLAAFFTSAPILASSAAVNSVRAKAVGHTAPSSRFALSLKPALTCRWTEAGTYDLGEEKLECGWSFAVLRRHRSVDAGLGGDGLLESAKPERHSRGVLWGGKSTSAPGRLALSFLQVQV